MGYLRTFWEDVKARRRGETRVAPRGTRGRVYAKPEGGSPAGMVATSRPKAAMTARIIRKDGTIEDLGTVAKG